MGKATEYAAWLEQAARGTPVPCDDFDQQLRGIAAELRRLAAENESLRAQLAQVGAAIGAAMRKGE